MARIILCTHNSGGVGKTTLAVHITGILTSKWRGKTLLVDCDDQADSWQFYTKRTPNKDFEYLEINEKLAIFENKNREKITRRINLEEYQNIVLDIDSPLDNTVKVIVDNNPDFVFIPVNFSQKHKALENLFKPLEVLTSLEIKAGYSPKVIIVPLGIKQEIVSEKFEAIGTKPQNCCIAQAMKNVQMPMSEAIYKNKKYLWESSQYSDARDYFRSLLTEHL